MKVRCWRMAPSPQGYVEEEMDLRTDEIAFVMMHCWKVLMGPPEGPPIPPHFYFHGMKGRRRVREVVINKIKPALDAARKAGLTVVHVQSEDVAKKNPEMKQPLLLEKQPPNPFVEDYLPRDVVPGHRKEYYEKVFGKGYEEWAAGLKDEYNDIPEILKPPPSCARSEYLVVGGDQFNRILRALGVGTLVYTGFATNVCLLHSTGGVREMGLECGYRIIVLRDATAGCEFEDTEEDLTATKMAIREIETRIGYTALTDDFIKAC